MSPRRRGAIEWTVALLLTFGCLIAAKGDIRDFIVYGFGVLAVLTGGVVVLQVIVLLLRWYGRGLGQ